MSIKKSIKQPNVSDIIKELQKLPGDTPFIMIDPDTEWVIDTVHIETNDKRVSFTGKYPEMTHREEDEDA